MKKITDLSQLDLSKQYTYADYLTWHFKDRVELIKGWIYKMSPAPRRIHQKTSFRISHSLFNLIENKCEIYEAPFDVRLDKNIGQKTEFSTVVQPDISIICDQSKLDEKGCSGAPDMIVEILSPSTQKIDTYEKFNLYQENLVKEYWIVNPDAKSIEVFALNDENKYYSVGIYNELDGYTEVPVNIFPELKLSLKD
ncbi:MAG TPA: Uma2 family endonuclease, partial [Saprospiraceae bacterium]|nr:Uma2 family endonuclease [Saprospiraceae bacterium]